MNAWIGDLPHLRKYIPLLTLPSPRFPLSPFLHYYTQLARQKYGRISGPRCEHYKSYTCNQNDGNLLLQLHLLSQECPVGHRKIIYRANSTWRCSPAREAASEYQHHEPANRCSFSTRTPLKLCLDGVGDLKLKVSPKAGGRLRKSSAVAHGH